MIKHTSYKLFSVFTPETAQILRVVLLAAVLIASLFFAGSANAQAIGGGWGG